MNQVDYYCENRFRVTCVPTEMRMSHWVYAPLIEDTKNDKILLDLRDKLWDLTEAQDDNGSLKFKLRKYPGTSGTLDISINADSDTYFLEGRSLTKPELEGILERWS